MVACSIPPTLPVKECAKCTIITQNRCDYKGVSRIWFVAKRYIGQKSDEYREPGIDRRCS